MKNLFIAMHNCMKESVACVLTTIIADSGSTPRGAGARMLTLPNGTTMGTVGGGAVEFRAQEIARNAMQSGQSSIQAFILKKNDVEDLGMICGGNVRMYFQYIDPQNQGFQALIAKILDALDRNIDLWLIMDVTDASKCKSYCFLDINEAPPALRPLLSTRAIQKEVEGRQYYAEPLGRAGNVYIFGGGHISRELVPLLTHAGFSCTVLEDRAEFAKKNDFPGVREVLLGDFAELIDRVRPSRRDYVIVVTRGHRHDYTVQSMALAYAPYYLGVIGSRNKVGAVAERLRADGFTKEQIQTIHSPIGLEISAETPAEIAVSIAAELIMARHSAL